MHSNLAESINLPECAALWRYSLGYVIRFVATWQSAPFFGAPARVALRR